MIEIKALILVVTRTRNFLSMKTVIQNFVSNNSMSNTYLGRLHIWSESFIKKLALLNL